MIGKTSDPITERALVGSIVDCTFNIRHRFPKPEVFEIPLHRYLWSAACKIRNRGESVNHVTVNKQLASDGYTDAVLKEIRRESELYITFEQWSEVIRPPGGFIWDMACDDVEEYHRNREWHNFCQEIEFLPREQAFERFKEHLHGANGCRETPKHVGVFDFLDCPPDPKDNLLGNRFVERTGSLLFVAQSGIGKSSASVQQDIEWSCGRVSFGIKPNGPLKILTIQAEDTVADMHEFVHGVKSALSLTNEEIELCNRNCRYVAHREMTGLPFLQEIVEPLLKKVRPDILRLNPLNSYLGADISDPFEIAKFCRNTLNKMLEDYNCGCILVHHTPKTTYQNKDEWKQSDWMYACTGSADLTNWARAILVISAIKDDDKMFAWIAAKRGRKLGWSDENGVDACLRYFKHSDGGSIVWAPVDDLDAPKKEGKSNAGQKAVTPDKIRRFVTLYFNVGMTNKTEDSWSKAKVHMSRATFFRWLERAQEAELIVEAEGGWNVA